MILKKLSWGKTDDNDVDKDELRQTLRNRNILFHKAAISKCVYQPVPHFNTFCNVHSYVCL